MGKPGLITIALGFYNMQLVTVAKENKRLII